MRILLSALLLPVVACSSSPVDKSELGDKADDAAFDRICRHFGMPSGCDVCEAAALVRGRVGRMRHIL